MKTPDVIDAVSPIIEAFNSLGILYYIGGSIASSAYGVARSTLDVDMVSELKIENAHALTEMLKGKYYIDEEMILEAVKKRSSFNIIHLETMFKVDIFLKRDDPYSREAFARKRKENLNEDRTDANLYLASCEDIILSKLEWFRMGNEISEKQWNDVLGVIKVQGDLLDKKYLTRWAKELGLDDLLERAFKAVSHSAA